MRRLMQTLLTGMLLAAAPSVATAETHVIVSRNAEVMVVYLRAPLADVSGTPFAGLAPPGDPDTTMRDARDGALEAIEDMATRLTLTVDGVRVPLIAQSAVYHRAEDALAFETPLDASIASLICATPDARLPDASDLTIYAVSMPPGQRPFRCRRTTSPSTGPRRTPCRCRRRSGCSNVAGCGRKALR